MDISIVFTIVSFNYGHRRIGPTVAENSKIGVFEARSIEPTMTATTTTTTTTATTTTTTTTTATTTTTTATTSTPTEQSIRPSEFLSGYF